MHLARAAKLVDADRYGDGAATDDVPTHQPVVAVYRHRLDGVQLELQGLFVGLVMRTPKMHQSQHRAEVVAICDRQITRGDQRHQLPARFSVQWRWHWSLNPGDVLK